jgi:hypothetical protein
MTITADSWRKIEQGIQLLLDLTIDRVDLQIDVDYNDMKGTKAVDVCIYRVNKLIRMDVKL